MTTTKARGRRQATTAMCAARQAAVREGGMGATGRDIVVIGASAGGLEALLTVVGGLPADLPAAVLVVLHLPAGARSALASILARGGRLPVLAAADGMPIAPGHIYVAPPNRYHLVCEDGRLRLPFGPREHGVRPAADPLFRSAARAYGPRVVGMVLSGVGADGAAGLAEIVRQGGVALAQDPDEASFAGMPRAALARVAAATALPAAALATRVVALAGEAPRRVADPAAGQGALARLPLAMHQRTAFGVNCPECGGSLWAITEPVGLQFECRAGHVWGNVAELAGRQMLDLERAAWGLIEALAERAILLERLASEARERDEEPDRRAAETIAATRQLATTIRERLPDVL